MERESGETTCPALLLGVDGGGTNTVAWLASRCDSGRIAVLGKGKSGPSNPRFTNVELAYRNILEAVRLAFVAAQIEPECVPRACLALAGAGREETRRQVQQWAIDLSLAAEVCVVHDAEAVLAATGIDAAVVALIAGTGSFAYGRGTEQTVARSGGWGFLLGDEGSAFAVGLEALRSVCRASDGRAPQTNLTAAILEFAQLNRVEDLIRVYSTPAPNRATIAQLARFVTAAAEAGDEIACRILDHAAVQLADMVRAVVARLEPHDGVYTLAVAGGVLVGCPHLQKQVERQLFAYDLSPTRILIIGDPVLGALKLAAQL